MGPLRLAGPEATEALGRRLAAALRPGDALGLVGELGAGKTLLTRAICEALGVQPEDIASPTYAIVNEYAAGSLRVYHADLYRLGSLEQVEETGLLERAPEGILIAEWWDRVPALRVDLVITLRHEGPEARSAELAPRTDRGAELAAS